MVKSDLSDAYHQLPIYPADLVFLGINSSFRIDGPAKYGIYQYCFTFMTRLPKIRFLAGPDGFRFSWTVFFREKRIFISPN